MTSKNSASLSREVKTDFIEGKIFSFNFRDERLDLTQALAIANQKQATISRIGIIVGVISLFLLALILFQPSGLHDSDGGLLILRLVLDILPFGVITFYLCCLIVDAHLKSLVTRVDITLTLLDVLMREEDDPTTKVYLEVKDGNLHIYTDTRLIYQVDLKLVSMTPYQKNAIYYPHMVYISYAGTRFCLMISRDMLETSPLDELLEQSEPRPFPFPYDYKSAKA